MEHPDDRALDLVFIVAIAVRSFWPWALGLFVLEWILQFVGHGMERRPPEFFRNWARLSACAGGWQKSSTQPALSSSSVSSFICSEWLPPTLMPRSSAM